MFGWYLHEVKESVFLASLPLTSSVLQLLSEGDLDPSSEKYNIYLWIVGVEWKFKEASEG